MSRSRLLPMLTIFLLEACTVSVNEGQKTTTSAQIPNPNKQAQTNKIKTSDAKQKDLCLTIRRPLNPVLNPQSSETDLDRYFRLAYNSETEGNFEASIKYYRIASELATCECDRAHAKSGEQAAIEASKLHGRQGISGKPTQFFWSRLQELTKSLSCVTIR